ncbi:MAG: enoyl-CoA hydratase/isomerase family protein [Spirochaetota bacterium]
MGLIKTEIVDVYSGKIQILKLDNPTTRNSMTREMGEAFQEEIHKISSSSEKPRCVIITGANNVFSSGGDLKLLKSFREKSLEENKKFMYEFYNSFLSIRNLACPVVGAVNGHAIGAALSLAFACDFRIFSESSKYSFNFVRLGIHPGMGASFLTRELFGIQKANNLLQMAHVYTGKEMYDMGYCNDAVPSEDVIKRSMEFAIELSEVAPLALQELKQNTYNKEDLQAALKKEAESQARNFLTEDFGEALKSLEEKRNAIFKGK